MIMEDQSRIWLGETSTHVEQRLRPRVLQRRVQEFLNLAALSRLFLLVRVRRLLRGGGQKRPDGVRWAPRLCKPALRSSHGLRLVRGGSDHHESVGLFERPTHRFSLPRGTEEGEVHTCRYEGRCRPCYRGKGTEKGLIQRVVPMTRPERRTS